jgi:hypothetical protein
MVTIEKSNILDAVTNERISFYEFKVEDDMEYMIEMAKNLARKLGVICNQYYKTITIDEGLFIQTYVNKSAYVITFKIPATLFILEVYKELFLNIMDKYRENIVKFL